MTNYGLYVTFLVASALVIAMPGPSVFFVVARSIEHGARRGLVSVLGVAGGALTHTALVALGLARIFQTSPLAFAVIKNLGALYLIYLGLRTLSRTVQTTEDTEATPANAVRRLLLDGFMVELLNPKTALFFLAFLPQFVVVGKGAPLASQILLLGVTFVVIGVISDGIYCIAAAQIGQRLKRSNRFQRSEKYISGSTYLGLGLATLIYGRRP